MEVQNNFGKIRRIIEGFYRYGMSPFAELKHKSFNKDLEVSAMYLSNMIYDLENELQVDLDDEQLMQIERPIDLVNLLVKPQT